MLQQTKMEPYLGALGRSCSESAGAVSYNTKPGLLENQPAVEAADAGNRTSPPLSILILAFRNVSPLTWEKKANFIDFLLQY